MIHFAAESHVDKSIDSPFDFVNTNVNGTVNLLYETMTYLNENIDKYDSFKFIHISTDEVFGSLGAEGVFSENSRFAPNSPYSASKAASDHFVRSCTKLMAYHLLLLTALITMDLCNFLKNSYP